MSRALNGYPEVGAKTRARVLEAAERLDYRPNPVAQRLATGRANAIGILFSDRNNMLESPIVTDLLAGISETAAERGLAIHLYPIRAGEEAAACERIVGSGAVDALVLLSPILDEPETSELAEIDFPVVAHGRPIFGQNVASLSVDNVGAFQRAPLISPPSAIAASRSSTARRTAPTAATGGKDSSRRLPKPASSPGRAPDGERPADLSPGPRGRRADAGLPERPTAFLCSSILLATGASRAIAEAGLSIPGDISLVAHDDAVAALPADMAFAGSPSFARPCAPPAGGSRTWRSSAPAARRPPSSSRSGTCPSSKAARRRRRRLKTSMS